VFFHIVKAGRYMNSKKKKGLFSKKGNSEDYNYGMAIVFVLAIIFFAD